MVSRLARVRVSRNLSQEQLAREAGVPLRTLRAIERREAWNPGVRYLINLSRALDCPLVEICEPDWFAGTDFGAPR